MPEQLHHRGPHPQDQQLFCTEFEEPLREATSDLSWLLTRGYGSNSSIKIVGDRYGLAARQRVAVSRSACSDQQLRRRRQCHVDESELAGSDLWIDGFNLLTTIEAALSGGLILLARDGCCRDMASMHGNYRRVQETLPAVRLIGEFAANCNVSRCHWILDSPVSNSGRLKTILRETAERHGWDWEVQLVHDADALLIQCEETVASADSHVLDRSARWFNLARVIIETSIHPKWVLSLDCGS